MANVFDNPRFAIQYEQVNRDLGDIYGQFAATLIGLMGVADDSKVLDLGCGTGISTSKLFDANENITVVGVEQSQPFLDIARLRFGLADTLNVYSEIIRSDHPYHPMIRDLCEVKDLEAHLKEEVKRYKKFGERVTLHQLDASQIDGISDELYDSVLASQIFHWFRKKDAKPDQPNLEYERKVLQAVRNKLKQDGLFGFNTPGWSFRFEDEAMNEKHLSNHPFYTVFMESIRAQLGKKTIEEKKFDHREIERITRENGFKIEVTDQKTIVYSNPRVLIESCLVGGQMQIFQKSGIKSTAEEREGILREAVKYALSKSSPEQKPVIETGVHYVVRKI